MVKTVSILPFSFFTSNIETYYYPIQVKRWSLTRVTSVLLVYTSNP